MTGPITITYHQAVKAGACRNALDRMRDSDIIGGDWGRFGRETPIPLTTVLDVLGEIDMWWALWAVDKTTSRLLASDFAAHVHRCYDRVRPDDTRPRDAISVARARDVARDAAWAAAKSAAGSAARDAAEAAAWAAEAAWAAARDTAEAAAWAAEAAEAARAAAWAAEAADAAEAARAAAWAAEAARAARAFNNERAWQTDHARAVLSGERPAGEVEITMHAPDQVVAS